jgi:predicted nucleotidyltransferase
LDSDINASPTPYKDINAFLQILLKNIRNVLGHYFTGMYLFGSLAIGGFDTNRSDIDFLVVTSEELPKTLISGLQTMHARLYESGAEWAKKLEGAYIPIDTFRVYSPTGPVCPLVNQNKFLVGRPESNWVLNRYILYTSGLVVTGPPLQTLIDPVRPEQLREAVLTLLRNNWTPWLYNPDFFVGEGHQPFVVLTMCHVLYTLKHGTVASKLLSAEWVTANSDIKWTQLIKEAMAWHYGDPLGDVGQTQEFLHYVLKEAGIMREF